MTVPIRERFTVVAHDLAQHPHLSGLAVGVGVHIQSVPDGTRVGIKDLALRLSEGEIRIAAALRELEKYGFLHRFKERLPSGKIVTRTVWYNKPRSVAIEAPAPAEAPAPEPLDPQPASDCPAANDLLAGLRAHDPRLLLTPRDVHRLTPAVSTWLERGVPPAAVRHALTNGLPPDPIRHPAALLAHRLKVLLPPPLPTPPREPDRPPRPDPLQTCDGCDRAFRAAGPGRCRDCRGRGGVAA
ncbi:helix-turn-helix domain-containing protein [Streptomyces sp. NPDC059063]|uniref:helix-turn-helix domain-containing protein n=1 Tax=unclassified Streptomyces TaxID=2593676 RepID=UPI00368416B3